MRAGLLTRFLYVLALLAFIPGALTGASSWISLTLGGGVMALLGPSLMFVIAALIVFRSYQVLRYPAALDARRPNVLGWLLRVLGWGMMLGGAVAGVGLFLVKPVTLALTRGDPGDAGIGYFAAGLVLAIGANLGWLGCALFEISRACGARGEAAQPWSRRRQDLAVFASLVAAALGAPYLLRATVEAPCGDGNLARCVSSTEGGVRRVIALPHGEAVALETTVEEIEFRGTSGRKWSVKESPAVSLKTSGHAASADAARVRVRVDAAQAGKAVVITLAVLDGLEETARFTTTFRKNAALERSPSGTRIVVDLPANAESGLRSVYGDGRHSLDQLFIQLRGAIGTEIEAREWPARLARKAMLLSASSDAAQPAKALVFEKANIDATCKEWLVTERGQVLAFEGSELGMPLRNGTFSLAADAGPHVLFSARDRVICRADEVWIVSYAVRRPDLRIRRYAVDGRLLRFVDTTLPIAWPDYDLIDAASVREEAGRIRFDRVIWVGGEKPMEKKREPFELVLQP